jgi:hypothetical protein
MFKTISPQDLIKISENISYILYGLGFGGIGIFFFLSIIYRYISRKLKELEEFSSLLEYTQYRVDGIESFTKGLIKLDSRLTLMETILERRQKKEDEKEDAREDRRK